LCLQPAKGEHVYCTAGDQDMSVPEQSKQLTVIFLAVLCTQYENIVQQTVEYRPSADATSDCGKIFQNRFN
jgi:transposase